MKRILVIDDEEWLREMMHIALGQRGFEVIEAENGAVGIEKARKELPIRLQRYGACGYCWWPPEASWAG